MRGRKGVVSIQINWIFVLIVGGLILTFFLTIVMKQKDISDTKHTVAVKQHIDAILVSAQEAVDTYDPISIPDTAIEFSCNEYFVGEFESGAGQQLGLSRIVFAPDRIEGKQILTWAKEWNIPFKIVNFLYLAPTDMRYIFVYDSTYADYAEKIYERMPDVMSKEGPYTISEASAMEDRNNYKVRYVYFGRNDPSALRPDSTIRKNDKAEVSMVWANPGDSSLVFYSYNKQSNFFNKEAESFYFDYNSRGIIEDEYPTLYGAIFTDSAEIYECMLKKGFERAGFVSDVYLQRAKELSQANSGLMIQRGCKFLYTAPISSLTTLQSMVEQCAGTCSFSSSQMLTAIESIRHNNEVLQGRSCPLLY